MEYQPKGEYLVVAQVYPKSTRVYHAKPEGGPMQMLLTPALNLLLRKMWPLEQHLGLIEKSEKLTICTGN
jgi:hypothetical protein